MIKVILLDFGGVLFSSPWRGRRPPKKEVDRLKDPVTKVLEENWPKIEAKNFGRDLLKEALLQFKTYQPEEIEAIIDSLTLIDEALLKLVKKLKKQGLTVYSFNNERPFWTDFRRIYFSLDEIFSGYFVSCQTGFEKPDPRSFQYVLETLKVSSENCFFIDDKEENVGIARKLGFLAHHFTEERRLENELQKYRLIA